MSSLVARLRTHSSVPLYRNAYALMLSGGASAVLGVVYWILASRFYEPEVVGTSSSAIAALMFLTGLASLYLDGSLIRFVPRAGSRTGRLVAVCYAISAVGGVVVGLAFALGIDVWAPGLGFLTSTPWWVAAVVAAVVLSCIFTLEDGVLTGLRQAKWVPIENIAYAVAKIVLLVALAGAAHGHGILISWVAPLILIVPPVNLLIVRLIRRHVEAPLAEPEEVTPNRVARYAGGNYLGFLFSLATLRLPPLLVLNAAGSAASAYFYLPWMIASTLTLLVINVSVSLIVEGTVDDRNMSLHIRRAVVHVLRLLTPVVIALLIAAPLVLHVFGADYAEEGSALLRLLALAAIPNAVCVLAFGVARLQDRVNLIVVAQLVLAVLTLGSSALLLPGMGIEGFGVGWLASQGIVALVLTAVLLRPVWSRPAGVSAEGVPSGA